MANVRVFFPNATYPSWLKPRSRVYKHLDPSFTPQDVKVSYYDYPALPLISRPFNGWTAGLALVPHVRHFAPDIIFSYFLYPEGYAALQIGKTLFTPVVARSMGSDINNIGDRISEMHTRTVLREADYLIMPSSDLRDRAIAMGAAPERTRTIVNACDLSVFHVRDSFEARQRLHIDQNSSAVVYIGRLDMKKGLRELVQASCILHAEMPGLQTYLVGEGPDRSIVESVIHFHNASSYIHVLPPCSFDEVAEWMAVADVVTLPSYMEGCPNVVLEALACGRPVVATNVGGIPEIMNDDCGLLVRPRDPSALARALAWVLDRTWDAEAISAQRSRSWNHVASELLGIFEMLVSTRQAPIHAQ
jgi:glycosyltransferase involved in cell wall biosynthesis